MKHICQSKEWARFKESYGNKAVTAGGVTFFKTKIPLIPHFAGYCPKVDLTKVDFAEVQVAARGEKCVFVKFDPARQKYTDEVGKFHNFLRKSDSIFAKETILLDLTLSLEKLKANLKSKTRYNVGLAKRKGVTVREGSRVDLEIFLKLQKETSQRQGFYVHNDVYFKKMWQILYPAGMLKLLVAEVGGKPAAAWIFFVYNETFYYPYGASDNKFSKYMPSDLLMWEAIKLGKKLKCKQFDMWGATSDKSDPWCGFTRFKLGFGGRLVEYVDSFDLVINKPLYYAFMVANKIRWFILNLKHHG